MAGNKEYACKLVGGFCNQKYCPLILRPFEPRPAPQDCEHATQVVAGDQKQEPNK